MVDEQKSHIHTTQQTVVKSSHSCELEHATYESTFETV